MGYYGLKKDEDSTRPYTFCGNPVKFLLDIYLGNDIVFIDAVDTGDAINFEGHHVLNLRYTVYTDNNLIMLSDLSTSSIFNYIKKCHKSGGSVDTITIYNNTVISAHNNYAISNHILNKKYMVFRCPESKIPKAITDDMLRCVPTWNSRSRVCCVANGYIRHGIHEINDGNFNLILQGPSLHTNRICYSIGNYLNIQSSYYLQDLYIPMFYNNQRGVHVNFDKLKKDTLESSNDEFRIPLNDDDYTKLSYLLTNKSMIVNTDCHTNLLEPNDDFDLLNLFEDCITVTTLKKKTLERLSKTKTSRDAGVLQTYLISIYISLVLTNDLIPPEGCYLNLFNFGLERARWRDKTIKQQSKHQDTFYVVDSLTVAKLTSKLAKMYKGHEVTSSQVGGGSNPITKYIHTPMVALENISSWLSCLDTATPDLIGGLARSTKSGLSIANKSTNLMYLTSIVYALDYEKLDYRCSGIWGHSGSSYELKLYEARKQFYDLNILPNDKRLSALNANIKNIKKLTEYPVRLREIYTLSDQALTLLETGFKPFKSIIDVCSWWLSMLPLFRAAINPDKYNEHGLKSLNVLLDTTASILTQLTEELQED